MYVCTVHRADYNYSLGRSLVKQKPIAAGIKIFFWAEKLEAHSDETTGLQFSVLDNV